MAVFAIPAKFVAARAGGGGRARASPTRSSSPPGSPRPASRSCRTRSWRSREQHGVRLLGPEHLRLLLDRGRTSAPPSARRTTCKGGVALTSQSRRHRHGDPRLRAHHEDGRVGDRRARQQVRPRRGRPAHLLRRGPEHRVHRDAPGGPQGRARVRRGGAGDRAEEAGRRAQGGPYQRGREGGRLAHRRAGGRRRGVRRHPAAGRRHPGAGPERHAGVRAGAAGAAHAEGRQRRHHHGRGRLGRAAVGRDASTTGCP